VFKKVPTSDLVRTYFRGKTKELAAASQMAIAQHAGLVGGHREQIHRIYLHGILPARFGAGRGMVYGVAGHSRECDVIIWDSANFPSLPLSDHSFFFADSVRAIMEVKSSYSDTELRDICDKCAAVQSIMTLPTPNLADTIAMLQLDVAALKAGQEHDGILHFRRHIGTTAVVLSGGATLTADNIPPQLLDNADECWPDALLLLEPGRVIAKQYDERGGRIGVFDMGEDALLLFTSFLMGLLFDRIVQVEDPLYLQKYVPDLDIEPAATVPFPLLYPLPRRVALWREPREPE